MVLGSLQQCWISAMVHPCSLSNDHVPLMLCLSEVGHLHHIHACVQVAFCMPQTTTKYFKSPHKNYSMSKHNPSVLTNVNICTSFRISLKSNFETFTFSVEFMMAIVWFPLGDFARSPSLNKVKQKLLNWVFYKL